MHFLNRRIAKKGENDVSYRLLNTISQEINHVSPVKKSFDQSNIKISVPISEQTYR